MAYVAGFFVDDIESWKIYEDTITRQRKEIPESESCKHMTIEQCKSENPKFCPECGTKTRVIPAKIIEEIKNKTFVRYKNNIFHSKKEKSCGCFDCEDCKNCKDCEICPCQKCKYCPNCQNNLFECRCQPCTPSCVRGKCIKRRCDFNDLPICKYPDLSDYKEYTGEYGICSHYAGQCSKCLRKYYENLKGYFLKDGYKLVYVDNSFCILYTCLVKLKIDIGVEIDDELLNFRQSVSDFAIKHEIEGDFEVRYIHF